MCSEESTSGHACGVKCQCKIPNMGLRFECAASDREMSLVWTCDMHMWANDMTTGMQAHVIKHMRGCAHEQMHSHCASLQFRRTRVPRRAVLRVIRARSFFLHFRQGGSRAPAEAGEKRLRGPGFSGKLDMLDISSQCQPIHFEAPTMAVCVSPLHVFPCMWLFVLPCM